MQQNFYTKLINFIMQNATKYYLHLDKSQITPLIPQENKQYLLYMHVPFCATLCTYCSFNRFLFNEAKARAYFKNLRKEMRLVKQLGFNFNSIYVGGGTTSILPDELNKTLDLARELFDIKEVSCESDPNHLQKEVLESFKNRIDRLSVGVQSFNDGILKKIGRYDKFGSGEEVYKKLEGALGILPIINIDLIFNFPNQTQEMLQKDLDLIKSLKPNQCTTYPLMSSPSVKSALKRSIGEVSLDNEAKLYELILQNLQDSYTPLSSWAFSKKGDAIFDEYVVDNDEYVGIGTGSFSFLNGVLYANTFSLKEYDEKINSGKLGVAREKKYSKKAQLQYRLMVELFGGKLDSNSFKKRYGENALRRLWMELLFLQCTKNIYKKDNNFYPTEQGKYLFLSMMKEFYIGMDKIREESRAALKECDM